MKILVGELSAITRSIEKELFGFNSFFSKIEFARSWEEILQQVKENRPDGIILDENLVNEKTLDSAIAKIKTLGIKTILTTETIRVTETPGIKSSRKGIISLATSYFSFMNCSGYSRKKLYFSHSRISFAFLM